MTGDVDGAWLADEQSTERRVQVDPTVELHSLVRALSARLSKDKGDEWLIRPHGFLNVRVSRDLLPRALAIMNALLLASEARGWQVSAEVPIPKRRSAVGTFLVRAWSQLGQFHAEQSRSGNRRGYPKRIRRVRSGRGRRIQATDGVGNQSLAQAVPVRQWWSACAEETEWQTSTADRITSLGQHQKKLPRPRRQTARGTAERGDRRVRAHGWRFACLQPKGGARAPRETARGTSATRGRAQAKAAREKRRPPRERVGQLALERISDGVPGRYSSFTLPAKTASDKCSSPVAVCPSSRPRVRVSADRRQSGTRSC